ncbi:discoidin domain-containing protein [Myceligenerans pegani]|uniref:Discoidin domain-containing protein n=1 Tax=Myceligenerans pegani TaxID=2776917 RepID=A0ABR9MVV8_9MICO|nr:discoidin domain-containing protein [Myceligenerans sp. TRM 65318]MBE1875525.1 discoidin domain-containing protein [Myceligenerans sp. TRM 65318]MBE3017796.1 discoidin domain-containing protein [Myceligenerans sp. TRM 65318]
MRITRRRDRQRGRWRSVTAALGAAVLSTTLLVPAAAATEPAAAPAAAGQAVTEAATTEPPQIVRSTSDAGFTHPGVGLTADHLENARTQVLAGVEPWASYYEAMTETGFASRTFRAQNAGPSDDEPRSDTYDNAGMRSRALNDGTGALTQALRYVVTGDEVYRANALHVIRTWSSMDPAKYVYFPDAHIHTGEPLYKLLAAAEIIRSTTPVNDSLDGYDLRWTDRDQQRIEDNLIRPVLDTFLFSQNRLWNQHLYGVVGMIAAAIFLDDAELYAERVEWYTVNSTYTSEHTINGGDVNGSLVALYRVIDADDPLNPYGYDFVQHIEMGRDQAHAAGDVDILTALARIVHNQGTRLDPVDGTVSTAPDAVTPYEFLGNRTLAGADVFAAFMLGEDVPFIDTSGGSGKLSQAYRGRLIDPASELYYQYTYVAGVDVETEAPHVAEAFAHRDGPRYYNGTGVANFWNLRGSDFNAAEYWVAFPPQLADENVTVPPLQDGPELQVARFGHAVGAGAQVGTDDDGTGYVRLDATAGDEADDGYVAVRRAAWAGRNGTSLVGFRVRTDATATLEVRPSPDAATHATVTLPDTGGEWRYVTLDIDQAKHPVSPVGSNIVFLSAADGAAPVDVASVLAQANGTLTPVTFDVGDALSFVAVVGEPIVRPLATSGATPDVLTLQDTPSSASLTADGTLTWTPAADDAGTHRLVVVASHEQTDTALPVTVTVAPDREAAIGASLDGLQEPAAYTAATWADVAAARDAARAGIEDADASEFAALLDDLRVAVDGLALLDPRLPDGTLDFSRIVDAPLSTPTLIALTDGDNQTTWGDQRVPSMVLDFGIGYRVRADAFGFLARDTFPNRAEGTNVYGSVDGESWTLLTEHPNAGDDVAIEEVPVREEVRDTRFRYLKLQIDEPGPPTDPAYPAVIWTLADFRIDGERTETDLDTVLELADAVDLTPYSRASRILFTRELEAVRKAARHPRADDRALAARLLKAWDLLEPAPVGTAEVRQPWVTASTPSWDGRRDAAGNGWAMFDGDPTTFTDTTQSSGWVSVIPDDGSTFTVETVRFLPRSGYASRANGIQFQGSDDGGQTWQTFATAGTVSGDSWQEIDLEQPVTVGAVRVLAPSGNTNLAEAEFVRSIVDTTAVRLYLDETAGLDEDDWTRRSWARLTEAREAAAAVVAEGADPTQEEADAAAEALAEAVACLRPRHGHGHPVRPPWSRPA